MYINCKTYFSFNYGTFGTEQLVKCAVEYGCTSLAITNINNTCDAWDFVDFCQQNDIKPVVGTEVRNDHKFMYLLLARNNDGFEQMNTFLSKHLQLKEDFPERPTFDDVFIIYPLGAMEPTDLLANEYIGVRPSEINKLYGKNTVSFVGKYVVRQPVTFQDKAHYNVHRLLRAIDKNTILTKQEKHDLAEQDEMFIAPSALLDRFRNHSHIVTNTLQLLDACSISLEFHTDKTKQLYSATKRDDKAFLAMLAKTGMIDRYGKDNKVAKERVAKELKIIDDLGFNAYFLITYDIIRYATSRGFFYIGRGSGGNSIVAYCLRITDVNPIELDLYFERFLNPHRSVPPDFDMDFSWKDRDEIIDYIFKRYGREHVCLLGSYVTFQERAVIRELGKVFGLPPAEIDHLRADGIYDDKTKKSILYYGKLIKDFPNHLSIHACGMLISDKPIYAYTATEMPPKAFPVSQIDMFIAEKIGLFKLDILSQRGLGHIKDAVELVRENKQVSIDIHQVEKFKKDAKVALQIGKADTIGCFYIESPAMRQLLLKLRCNDYMTLVAASSIIRPGVSQSGMMSQYVHRFHNPDKFEYLHPKMEELLKETYGVMVYQEDVIKVAHHFAGLDMSEADVLRRTMSGKYRSHKQFEAIRKKFFDNCNIYGYQPTTTAEVWRQIESFGGYSFSKAHSASFAVESYQSLFLKTYYPMEFMVAVINNFGGFYSAELYFHELKRTGAKLHLPCVNTSRLLTGISGTAVTMGLVHIQGLEQALCTSIINEREKYGDYLHIQDFIERIHPAKEQLNILVRIGAFRFSGKNKKELLWEANFLQKKSAKHSTVSMLFKEAPIDFQLPQLHQHPMDDAMDEIELLKFPVCNMFDLVDDDVTNYVPAKKIHKHKGKSIKVLGYLITSKPVHTKNNQTMFFNTFIDSDGEWLDTVFFPDAHARYPLQGRGFYAMSGIVIEEFGVFSLDVRSVIKIGIKKKG